MRCVANLSGAHNLILQTDTDRQVLGGTLGRPYSFVVLRVNAEHGIIRSLGLVCHSGHVASFAVRIDSFPLKRPLPGASPVNFVETASA